MYKNITPVNTLFMFSDCLVHNVFFSKPKFYRRNNEALGLLEKNTFVPIDNVESEPHDILCEILQGSVLGP